MPDELREALTVSGVSALIPKQIDPLLLRYVRRYSPLVQAIPDRQWNTNQYFWNRRTALPNGGPVVDGGARSVASSTYDQQNITIKLFQGVGAVTGFAQVVTRDLIGDLKAEEVRATAQDLMWAIETAFLWGNAATTNAGQFPTCDGLDTLVNQYAATAGVTAQNAIDEARATLSLSILDNLIDLVESNAAAPVADSGWMFVMSPRMNSKVQQLFSAQQRFDNGIVQVAGMNVPQYRGVPIIKSSFLGSRALTTANATATLGTGTLNATYNYRVSEVIKGVGETIACASQSASPSSQGVILTLGTANTYDSYAAIQYKVYRTAGGGAAGTETLLGIVDAFDTTGAAVTSITDNGTKLITNSSANTGPTAYVGTNAGQFPRGTNDEDIYLLPRDPDICLRPWTRWMQFINLAPTTSAPDTLPFAMVADTALAVRAPKYVGRVSRVSAVI